MRLTLVIAGVLLGTLVLVQPSVTSRPTYRAIDGTGNNVDHPDWGAANTNFIRAQVPVGYADTSCALTGTDRPGARDVSLGLMATNYPDKERYLSKHTSDMVTYIGQFFDHDLDKTKDGAEPAPIPIPKDDPFYNPQNLANINMGFSRSAYNIDSTGYRQTINIITSFIDGSLVYGSTDDVAKSLRTLVGGTMKMIDSAYGPMPPLVGGTNMPVDRMANDANRVAPSQLRAIGDVRGNVNPPILTFHTMWLREHNRLAANLAAANPTWDDEKVYQEARKWNIAFLQHVCFEEYVARLGISLSPYTGYNASVNPAVDAFFSTVSYRYGHSEVTDVILRVDDEGNEIPQGHLLLHTAYFNPNVSLFAGIDPILRGLTVRVQGYVEPRFSQAIQQFLFGFPGVNGSDLFARNIQRGRDHGIPDYNTCRKSFGLPAIKTFDELTNNTAIAAALKKLYITPDNCDACVCGLAEDKVNDDSHFGPLFYASLKDQYQRARDGDWYYYENTANGAFTADEIKTIKSTFLRDIILRNTDIKVLPDDIWHVDPEQPWPTGSCNASSADTAQTTQSVKLSDGKYSLSWKFVDVNGTEMAEITMSAPGTGWVAFGVAASASSGMAYADIVMANVASDGTATLQDSWATGFSAPMPDSSFTGCSSQTTLVSSSQVGGVTTITFRRPVIGQDVCDRPLLKDGPNNLIFAWNPTTDNLQTSHGLNKVKATITLSSSSLATEDLVEHEEGQDQEQTTFRKHGILMTIAWCFMMPLAVVCNRLKNLFSGNKPVQQAFFYMHIFFNVVAVALAAAGLGVPFSAESHPSYDEVAYSHGSFGIAIMVLIFVQILYPWFRPNPTPLTVYRRLWELGHTTLGWSIAVMGLVNIALGAKIFTEEFDPDVKFWGCLAGVPVCSLFIIANIVDRLNSQKAKQEATYKQNPEVATSKDANKGLPTTATSDSE